MDQNVSLCLWIYVSEFADNILHCITGIVAIGWHRSGSILAQVMACCLMAPAYYLNQCWLIIIEVLWQFYSRNMLTVSIQICIWFCCISKGPMSQLISISIFMKRKSDVDDLLSFCEGNVIAQWNLYKTTTELEAVPGGRLSLMTGGKRFYKDCARWMTL